MGHGQADEYIRPLSAGQALFYGTGGMAGGLVFTMMNNALPLYLSSYTMPFSLGPLFSAGAPVPATIVALLTNERSFFGGLIQPFIGQLSDHTRSPIGRRSPYVLAGGAATALAIAALALQPPFWLMIGAVTLAGIALFVALGPYVALLADITPPNQRGRVGSLIALAGVVGAVLFTVLSMMLWETARGWVFLLTALGVAGSLAVVALGVHEPPSVSLPVKAKERAVWREMLRIRPLAAYVGAMGIYWLGAGAATPFITRFGVHELGITEANSFTLLLVIVLSTAVGAVLSGVLADKVGKRRVLHPALALFAVAAIVGSQVPNIGWALPIMVLVGLGNAAPTALHLPLLADLVPKERAGAFMGFASMIWSVAQPVGSFLAGVLVDFSGSYRGVFLFAGLCMAAAALIMRAMPASGGGTPS